MEWIRASDETEGGKFLYTSLNTVIMEELNEEKQQTFWCETTDPIYKLVVRKRLVCGFTYEARVEGYACGYIWDIDTKKLVNSYCAGSRYILDMDISPCTNLVLMLSSDTKKESLISIWATGSAELLTKCLMTVELTLAQFNPYLNNHEFSVLGPKEFHFWIINPNSLLEYQRYEFIEDQRRTMETASFTTLAFSSFLKPFESELLLVGLDNGEVWICSTRTNSCLTTVALASTPILCLDYHDDRIAVGC